MGSSKYLEHVVQMLILQSCEINEPLYSLSQAFNYSNEKLINTEVVDTPHLHLPERRICIFSDFFQLWSNNVAFSFFKIIENVILCMLFFSTKVHVLCLVPNLIALRHGRKLKNGAKWEEIAYLRAPPSKGSNAKFNKVS